MKDKWEMWAEECEYHSKDNDAILFPCKHPDVWDAFKCMKNICPIQNRNVNYEKE